MTVKLIPVEGIPEASAGDDVAELVMGGLVMSGIELVEGDVLVVTHK
ncbi:MAG TPA: F420-0--gamma-glutamyl ligase, partial [Actinobacteria bacterium]|nr:F420-0--gamma-glutamyl ligase [Actinomycetota bacterium]